MHHCRAQKCGSAVRVSRTGPSKASALISPNPSFCEPGQSLQQQLVRPDLLFDGTRQGAQRLLFPPRTGNCLQTARSVHFIIIIKWIVCVLSAYDLPLKKLVISPALAFLKAWPRPRSVNGLEWLWPLGTTMLPVDMDGYADSLPGCHHKLYI